MIVTLIDLYFKINVIFVVKNILPILILFIHLLHAEIPNNRVIAEWEPALGTMIRWPLGIPSELVVELANDDLVYVLVETNNQQNQATNNFNNWGVNTENVIFISTSTYSHWTRDHGPEFLIGDAGFKVINQRFNGYPVENGCNSVDLECDDNMIMNDCVGTSFCNNQPQYPEEGYDCYINNELCEDFNGDGQIIDWIGDGYCDDGTWGLDFMCDEFSWDCGDCGGEITDENSYCENKVFVENRIKYGGRPLPSKSRGWDEDDDTNIDFANQLGWDILNLPLYWTGGNFMTDGYGMAFSTELMVNENNLTHEEFKSITFQNLNINDYNILENPNVESIQHIDCLAKLVNSETIIIKQVSESSPEYECIEEFAESFNTLTTFYDRPFKIHRIFCPTINGGSWETNPVAAYTNSLILNNKVLVPQYGIPQDADALNIFREAMPGYEVIGYEGYGNGTWYAEDALHCRTKGIFDPEMLHISHKSIRTEEITQASLIPIEAEVIDYGNTNLNLESVILYWKYSAEDGPFSMIELEFEDGNIYTGLFPFLNSSSLIEYFITAKNSNGNTVSHPIAGWHTFNTLEFISGDINGDNSINIQDVILLVNLVINNEYLDSADLNSDSTIDILDIVQLVNIILN